MPAATLVLVLFVGLAVVVGLVGIGLVVRQGWQLTKLTHEGVATTGTVTGKQIGRRRSILRYEYLGPDGTHRAGAAPVDGPVWSAAVVGGAIGVVYVATRPWISCERGQVNAARATLGLPPL